MALKLICFSQHKLNKMDVAKLRDFAFLFTVLAAAVQLTSYPVPCDRNYIGANVVSDRLLLSDLNSSPVLCN